MTRFIDRTNEWIGKAVSYFLAVMMVTICYEVVARYFFDRPTLWCMELNTYLLCIYCTLGAGFTLLRGGHVSVDILYGRFHFRTKAILDCVTSFLFFIFVFVILWYGSGMAHVAFKYGETSGTILDWPLFPTIVLVPVGALLLLAQGVVKFIKDFRTAVTGIEPEGGEPEGIFGKREEA
ncbi:MAG: TRAP transporter small permease subunit [Deltaproteobacteria bacterium]|nr:TRAP transporter small permease subunit [Deltaproteobacteria bacterium]